MPAAHFALLGYLIAARCDLVTAANGYDWERTRVVRTTMAETVSYEHGIIHVIEGDPALETDLNAGTNVYPYVGWTQDFLVLVIVVQSETETNPLADRVGIAAAAVLKAIAPGDRLGGQCHTLNVVDIEFDRAAPGEQGGVAIRLRATYQTHENRLDITPYPLLPIPE